jgi:hypothetical protein
MTPAARGRSSRTTRTRLTLEVLESRTLLAGNLFLTAQVPGVGDHNLLQYTQDGELVSSQPIPPPPNSSDGPEARGLSFGPSGDLFIYDGTFNPSLADLSPDGQTWTFQSLAGWSTVNNVSFGEVAAYNDVVFASDMFTFGGGEPNGIVRFDTTGDTPVRFSNGTDYIQVALGLDGNVYGLAGTNVHVFNPDTLDLVRSLNLQGGPDGDIRSIAVDGSGQIFAATWGGYLAQYDANGKFQTSVHLTNPSGGGENLINVALDNDGQIAVGSRFGDVFLTDESLASVQVIQTNQWNVFATFDHYIGTDVQVSTPSFNALAGPTIPFGQPTVTLGGQITAGAVIPTGSVSITVAGVTHFAAINPADGTFSATFATSALDVADSPYTIDYNYPGSTTVSAIDDTSQSLTVTQATTALVNLSSPTLPAGTPTVTVSGQVTSNGAVPVGQAVTVTVVSADGTVVASGSGTIGGDGSFSSTLNIGALPDGSYVLQYVYAGDNNFAETDNTGTLTLTPPA